MAEALSATLLLEAAFLVRLKLIAVRNAVAVDIFGILEIGVLGLVSTFHQSARRDRPRRSRLRSVG